MNSGHIYYASDKALFDALCQHKFKKSDLREIFLSRGVIHSSETSREDIAKHFSRLNHDFSDYQKIASVLSVLAGKEKSALIILPTDTNLDDIERSLKNTKRALEELDITCSLVSKGNGFELRINYEVFDCNKTEFRQLSHKDASIYVEKTDSEILIRYPSNDYVNSLAETIVDNIGKQAGVDLAPQTISLSGVKDPKKRIKFFSDLIQSLDGMRLDTVKEVSVFNPEDEESIGVHVTNVSLRGKGISQSDQLRALYAKGFYITKIIWIAEVDKSDSDRFTFEAQFSDPTELANFSYMVRSKQRYKSGGEYFKSTQPVNELENLKYSRVVESAARKSLAGLFAGGEADEK